MHLVFDDAVQAFVNLLQGLVSVNVFPSRIAELVVVVPYLKHDMKFYLQCRKYLLVNFSTT